ncbi:hypothetical protein [Infirmifilum sp.]|uniref:hypothetical protein n=1 Tax=Infirmifilum sp. TaxID=2856575 RepID=UPI003D0C2039
MRNTFAFILLILVSLLALHGNYSNGQPSYWIALNFKVTFNGDGTVVVEAKLHPFTVEGKSLLGDKSVESRIKNESAQTLGYILLMFSDNPRLLSFRVLADMEKRYGESVLCDVAGTGKMTKFDGAYVYSVLVYLNTSNYVSLINDSVYLVKVRDSFTSTDPRSWIDVIEFTFNGSDLLGLDWEPKFAQGPTSRSLKSLLWINYNEQEAPDMYIFEVKMPGLKLVGEPPEVKATIKEVVLEGTQLRVTVQNLESPSGYVYIVVKGTNTQARKVYLFSREVKEVVFPYVTDRNVTVLLYSGDKLLENRIVEAAAEPSLPALRKYPNVNGVFITIIAIVIFTVFAIWLARRGIKK